LLLSQLSKNHRRPRSRLHREGGARRKAFKRRGIISPSSRYIFQFAVRRIEGYSHFPRSSAPTQGIRQARYDKPRGPSHLSQLDNNMGASEHWLASDDMGSGDYKRGDGLISVLGKDDSFTPRRAWWRRKRWPLLAIAFVALLVSGFQVVQ
jgi:hypothetical protein